MSGSALIRTIATICLSFASTAPAQELARGDIIDRVVTIDDPAETYALYLPSTYTPDRQWNVLLGFHPMTLRVLLADLSKKAAAGADTSDRRRARRVLRVVASGANQRVQDPDYLSLIEKYRLPRT